MTQINQIYADKNVPDTSGLVKKDYNAKATEIESKVPSISGLATNFALTAVENKIPDVSNLVKKKSDYDTKISEKEKKVTDHNHDKYITTSEFNKFTAEICAARLAQGNLITKTDFDNKPISLNRKINSKQNIYLLKINLKNYKLETFDSIYFRGKSYFEEDGTQLKKNYLVFQPIYKYFKRINGVGSGNYIYFWKSKGLSDEVLFVLLHLVIVLL